MHTQQLELSIPKGINFQVIGDSSTNIYECQHDISLKISAKALLVKFQHGVFLVTCDAGATSEDLESVIYACKNTDVYHVRDVTNLESNQYSVEILLNNVVVECQKFQLKGNYYVWKIRKDADGVLHYSQHNHELDFTQYHEILAQLPEHGLEIIGSGSELYIQKDTQVKFDDGRYYKLCDDLCIMISQSRIICSSSPMCYHIGNQKVDNDEICHNPFESGKIAKKDIRLRTLEGYCFNVSVETFRRNIIYCHVSAVNLCSISRCGSGCYLVKSIEWYRDRAQRNYHMYNMTQMIRQIRCQTDSAISAQAKAFIDRDYLDWTLFKNAAIKIAVTANHPVLMQYLVAAGVDVKAYPDLLVVAVTAGHLDMVKLLVGAGLDPKPSINQLLPLVVKSGQVAVLEYLVSQGLDVTHDWYRYVELATQHNNHAMLEYLESLPVDWQHRQKILLDELAAVQKSFNRITKLMDTSAVA